MLLVYFPNTRHYATFADVTFHEDSLSFSSPLLSLTPVVASPPPGFSPFMVFLDPLPLFLSPQPPPSLSSPSPRVSSVLPTSSALDIDLLSPSSIVSSPSPDPAPPFAPDDLHLPIALCKVTRACTRHPISHFVSYDRLSPSFHAFALSVASESIPR